MDNKHDFLYEFSVPMPFAMEGMKQIIALNKKIKKSRITSVYNCLPEESEDFTTFEQPRLTAYPEIATLDDLFEIAALGKKEGIDFIYVCNSPAEKTEAEMMKACEKIDYLVLKMHEYGLSKIRATNIQLIDYLLINHPEIEIYASTSQEFTSTQEYLQMLKVYPNIKEILPSWDMNKNIRFLSGLKKSISQSIEIMVNEGCLPGCSFRSQHNAYLDKNNKFFPITPETNQLIDRTFYSENCVRMFDKLNWTLVCLSNIIYPWDIEKYSKATGIRKFKLVGRNCSHFKTGNYVGIYEKYLMAVDDVENINQESFALTNHYILDIKEFHPIKISDVKPYLPSIDYFIKNRPDCRNICGEQCFYCYIKAEELKRRYPLEIEK